VRGYNSRNSAFSVNQAVQGGNARCFWCLH
jgi:hypothetical protein